MFDLLISSAHAQAAGANQSPAMSFVPIILVFFVLYFFMIRPQKKKMDAQMKYISELKKGDEVYTKSGMIGVIYGLTEKIVTLELDGNIKVKFLRSQIAGNMKELDSKSEINN